MIFPKKFPKIPFIYIIILYLITRLVNLTLLPVFNDEAIYLNWGWIEITRRDLFYSLFDGKQPLLMWIFGYSQKILSDPLLAGRIISSAAGLLTLVGIYEIGKKFFSPKIAHISALLYIFTPLFISYERLALMESAISAIGVWLFYWYLRNKQNPRIINFIFIGFLIGIGFFIKSSAAIFIASFLALTMLDVLREKTPKTKLKLISISALSLLLAYLFLLPLIQRHDFSKIIELNNRYSYTLEELSFIPYDKWAYNLSAASEILFWHFTPVLFIMVTSGYFYLLKKNGNHFYSGLFKWITIDLCIFILFVKSPQPRYLISLTPLLVIPASILIENIIKHKYLNLSIIPLLLCGIFYTIIQIFYPVSYFSLQNNLTRFSDIGYINGWTSGYGINEAISYLERESVDNQIDVRVIGVSGNPDDAAFIYLRNKKNIKIQYAGLICHAPYIEQLKKQKPAPPPIYLLTRDNFLGVNHKCMIVHKKLYKPDKKNYIGIYKVRL